MSSNTQTEASRFDAHDNYLVFAADTQLFALPHHRIISILDNPGATRMPGMRDHARGVMDFMGEPVTFLDFRTMLGCRTIRAEVDDLLTMLLARKQDHINWLAKLKESVEQGSEITAQTDPHLCAFGKWYDHFQTDSIGLTRYLRLYDQPHKKIHAIAIQAKACIERGDKEGALALIHKAERRELALLIRLFDRAGEELARANSEYAIVSHAGGERKVALSVDEPRYFGPLDEIIYPLPPMVNRHGSSFVAACGFLKSEGIDSEILIVDLNRLVDFGIHPLPAGAGGS